MVNADDPGASRSVNNAIFDMIKHGHVTSTMMATGPHVDHAPAQLVNFPQASFGLHPNLTEFFPISGPKGLGSLLNIDGEFHGRLTTIKFWLLAVVRIESGALIINASCHFA